MEDWSLCVRRWYPKKMSSEAKQKTVWGVYDIVLSSSSQYYDPLPFSFQARHDNIRLGSICKIIRLLCYAIKLWYNAVKKWMAIVVAYLGTYLPTIFMVSMYMWKLLIVRVGETIKKIYFGTHQCIGLYENISLIIFLFPTNLEEKPISFVVKHFNFCCCCVGLIRFNQWTLSLAWGEYI